MILLRNKIVPSDSKYIRFSLLKLFYSLTRNNKKSIEVKKRLIGLSENVGDEIERTLSLGDSYYGHDKRSAYQCYRKAFLIFLKRIFRILGQKNKLSFFGNIKSIYLKCKSIINKKIKEEKDIINLALLDGIDSSCKDPFIITFLLLILSLSHILSEDYTLCMGIRIFLEEKIRSC